MAKKTKKAAAPAVVDKSAAESMEKAKRWAMRGDAKSAVDEYVKYPRRAEDFHALAALHPDIQTLLPSALRLGA